MDYSLISTYNKVNAADLGGFPYNRGKLNFQFNSTQVIALNASTDIELSGDYQSDQIYGTYAIKPYYGMDLGIKKTFLSKKLTLKLALTDVLDTRKARISSALNNLNYNLNQKLETRVFRLTLNYNLGSTTVKASRTRTAGATDAESRVRQ